jgi:hypothetical protein
MENRGLIELPSNICVGTGMLICVFRKLSLYGLSVDLPNKDKSDQKSAANKVFMLHPFDKK